MSKEILAMVEAFSNEKSLSKDVVFGIVESALQFISSKHYKDTNVTIQMNRRTGEFKTYNLVDNKVIELESVTMGRIGVNFAKNIINQKMKEAYNNKTANEYRNKIGSIVKGVIKKVDKGGNIHIDIGDETLVYIPKSELIPRESIKYGNKISALLTGVKEDGHNPLLGSRISNDFLKSLLYKEITDIINGKITVMDVARDAGSRAKVSIKCNLKNFDAIGAVIGMKGSRIQPIINELAGERIDIILWDGNDAQYVINAMSPAEIKSIVVDEDNHTMEISVPNENIPKTIGKNGQNVKLASSLTGWNIKVYDVEEYEKNNQLLVESLCNHFIEYLDIDADDSLALVNAGFTTIEEIAFIPSNELYDAGFDYDYIDELKHRAKDALLLLELSKEESNELESMAGMTDEFLQDLTNNNILSIQDLADLSIYDVEEFSTISPTYVGEMIMRAREIIG